MDLDRIRVGLRPRGPWEGMDLGFALGRAWFKPLFGLWTLAALPVALLALVVTGGKADWWVILVWWLKPLYEAPMVWWASRALFGECPSWREARPAFAATWTRRLLPYLLWRRLSLRRSLYLPIVLLEGSRGPALGARRRLLGEGAGGAWLTTILVHFEYILWGSALLLIYFLTLGNPILEGVAGGASALDLEAVFTDPGSWAYWLSAGLYLLAAAVLAPFYVCGGFALYIGRRTELEAWDLELDFRRAGTQVTAAPASPVPGPASGPASGQASGQASAAGGPRPAGRGRGALAAGVIGLVLLGAGATTPGVRAASDPPGAPPPALPEPAAARALIAEVLADRDFGYTRERPIWVADEPEREAPDPTWLRRLGDLGAGLGPSLRALLVLAAILALALLLRRILRDWQPGAWRRTRAPPAPGPLTAVGPAADPGGAALAAAVRARLAAGDSRGALALLYRGALAELVRRGLPVPDAATEGECLHLAAAHLATADRVPFERLTRDWRALAYAGVPADPARIGLRLAEWLEWTGRAGSPGASAGAPGPTLEPRP